MSFLEEFEACREKLGAEFNTIVTQLQQELARLHREAGGGSALERVGKAADRYGEGND